MDETRSSNSILHHRSKRQKPPEDGFWECSVCTYRNSPEAYKCDMCDIRKGTSTRKPRLNSQLVAQQAAQQFVPVAPTAPKRERNSLGLDFNSDYEFSDSSNQGNNSHMFEEPLNKSLNVANSADIPEVLPEIVKQEKPEKQKQEKHEKLVKSDKKPRKVNRAPKVKKTDKVERSEEKISVTVNDVTVIITDYVPKKVVKKEKRTSTEVNHMDNSDNSSTSGASNCNTEDLILENHHHP